MQYLIVDFEFTFYKKKIGRPQGFFPEIIEVGAVKISDNDLNSSAKLQAFVKPHFYPKQAIEAMDFCMISPADMKKALPFSTMLNKLASMYDSENTYFVTWGGNDFQVLDECCRKHQMNNPITKSSVIDISEAHRLWVHNANTLSLKAAAESLNISMDGIWHTAYDDADNTSKILCTLLKAGWTPELFFKSVEEKIQARRLKQHAKLKQKYGFIANVS